MKSERCRRRRAPDGSIEVLFSAECPDEICPCGVGVAECAAPGPSEDGVEVFSWRGRAFGRRKPKRKKPC